MYRLSIISQQHRLAEKIGREEKEEKSRPDRSCLPNFQDSRVFLSLVPSFYYMYRLSISFTVFLLLYSSRTGWLRRLGGRRRRRRALPTGPASLSFQDSRVFLLRVLSSYYVYRLSIVCTVFLSFLLRIATCGWLRRSGGRRRRRRAAPTGACPTLLRWEVDPPLPRKLGGAVRAFAVDPSTLGG